MNVRRILVLAIMLIVTCFASSALAQRGGGGRLYDSSTETTLRGTVSMVTNVAGNRPWYGIHLTLQSGDKAYDVHTGPSDYVTKTGFTFAVGDQIEVTGSKIRLNNADALIAREIIKDGKVLTLRDNRGFPMWSHSRWKAQ